HVHYKTCSTFDSSTTIGSIGKAIDCGASVFNNKLIPVLGGTPALGRYCLFGNLFARMGIGSTGDIYRLDRHPSMRKHPVTPATESDLRLHIGQQTNKKIGLINVLQLDQNIEHWTAHLKEDEEVVLIDALNDEHLQKIGRWMNAQANGSGTMFSAGPSAIEMALGSYWAGTGMFNKEKQWAAPGKATPLLVISGSCSPVTAAQIIYAKAIGFKEVIIDVAKILSGDLEKETRNINALLQQQENVVVHTGDIQANNLAAEKVGTALGMLAKAAVGKSLAKRVVIAGGDTSSYAARAMEIEAVEMIAPLVSGAPLCSAISPNKYMNVVEVNFKGGQVGSEDYFEVLLNGKLPVTVAH
ncbi:MAG: four-carbon acid sugar kinase family protein, partial [Ferruginibacter sp.]